MSSQFYTMVMIIVLIIPMEFVEMKPKTPDGLKLKMPDGRIFWFQEAILLYR